MTTRGWFQLSLLLPVAIPALLWPFGTDGGALRVVSSVAIGALLVGGVPHIRVMGRCEGYRVIQVAWLSPLGFAPIVALFVASAACVTSVAQGGNLRTAGAGLAGGAFFAACVLVVGYVYVILARLGYGLLTLAGWIDDPADASYRRAGPGDGRE